MARVESEVLADQAVAPVYMAKTVREARRVEELLSERGVDYTVEVEVFARTLLGSPRHGAMFYVRADQATYCRSALAASGFDRGVVEEEPDV